MKDWKDNEKLTGVDYTHERREVTTRLTEANTAADIKNSRLFVLSPTEPQDPYINIVWMDPNEFQILASLSTNINSEVQLQGYKTPVYLLDSTTTINANTDIVGYKIYGEVSLEPEITINADITLQGYKEQLEHLDLQGTINVDETLLGYKQQIHEEPYNEATINADLTIRGYKQLLVKQALYFLIDVSTTLVGYKETIQKESIDADITANMTLVGYKENLVDFNLTGTINADLTLDGYKDSLEDIIVNDTIYPNVTLQGYKVLEVAQDLLGTINATVDLEGYKVVFEDVDFTGTINPVVTLEGYKVDEEIVEPVVDSVDAIVTAEGLKVYEIYASSNVAFSGNSLFSLNYDAFPVAISSDLTFLSDAEPADDLRFNAPLTITEGGIKYELVSMYYTFNGDSSTAYPVTPAQLIYTVSMIGRIEIYFNYRRVPIIPVLAKAVDLTEGSQFFPDMTFELLDDSNNVVDSAFESIDQIYTQYFNFEDSSNYKLKVIPQSFYVSGSYREFTIDRLNIYYYNQQTSSYELRYADSVSPIILTVDPDTVNLEPPRYDEAFYVEAQYTSVQGSPPATTLTYSGSFDYVPAYDHFVDVVITTYCGDVDEVLSKLTPSNYSVGDVVVARVAYPYGGNYCSGTNRYMRFNAT